MAAMFRGQARGSRGQSTTEYAVFIGVVAAALVAMTVYVRRAVQAHLKLMEIETSAQPMWKE